LGPVVTTVGVVVGLAETVGRGGTVDVLGLLDDVQLTVAGTVASTIATPMTLRTPP
jgi:hypothetical protein